MGRLTGKVGVVTGAASGIGRAIAEAFAREGANLMITDIDEPSLAKTAESAKASGGQVMIGTQDVTDEARWDAVIQETVAKLGKVDCLVNNAGIAVAGPIVMLSLADFRRQQAVNVDSVFLGTRAAMRAMRDRGGSIVNLSSVAGLRGAAGLSAYCASKGAVRLFTKAAAVEAARLGYNIRVNSIHPGIIDTPIWEKGISDVNKLRDAANPEAAANMPEGAGANAINAEMLGMISAPLGRPGRAAEVADAAVFLASDESSYVTGAELVVDGGMTAG